MELYKPCTKLPFSYGPMKQSPPHLIQSAGLLEDKIFERLNMLLLMMLVSQRLFNTHPYNLI